MNSAKLGWMVAFKRWGIYLYSVKDSGISKMNDLNRFYGHTIRVRATLRYFPEPPKSDRIEAVPPEHFYFDVAEAVVTDLSPPRRQRSRRSRQNALLTVRTYDRPTTAARKSRGVRPVV